MRFLYWIITAISLVYAAPAILPSGKIAGELNIEPRAQNKVFDGSSSSDNSLCSGEEQAQGCVSDQTLKQATAVGDSVEDAVGEQFGNLDDNPSRRSLHARQPQGGVLNKGLLSGALLSGLPLVGGGGQ
ncbi:hypothetical protein MGYG_06678 [Nannizzia gypsea CBS 118893]|uniref:Uncharacterized protein n=1 Tax=Arthroderma gypseum (strain ATCC MYA-4604 / CBS 118893) TaxID=535722 RepID=E4V0W6_ARTGP|nr:hypothetical protein MGYG_06678 [Nannizzia gypsea CBS 118893]EFR03681.1 hypothetical protein MGYG_06678 [Nannizzia gypsea CBS 118893]